MLISNSHKFIFPKAAKVAGTSVQNFFEPFCKGPDDFIGSKGRCFPDSQIMSHGDMRARKINRLLKLSGRSCWNDYYTFGCIRNPWDRVVSLYHFIKKQAKKFHEITDEQKQYKSYPTLLHRYQLSFLPFDKFVEESPYPQVFYQFYHIEKLRYNYFIRFENLKQDVIKVCNDLNLPCDITQLQHINRSKDRTADYTEYFNNKTKNIIAERYKQDIEYFKYEYGD